MWRNPTKFSPIQAALSVQNRVLSECLFASFTGRVDESNIEYSDMTLGS